MTLTGPNVPGYWYHYLGGALVGKMMGEVALLAVGVMISPTAITLAILLVLQRKGSSSAVTFVCGRMLSIFLVLFAVLAFFHNLDFSPETTSSHAAAAAKIVIGALLLLLAVIVALGKSEGEKAGWLQKRMASIERISPLAAGGLGLAFGVISPRCLFLTLGAAATILHANTGVAGNIAALALFVVMANLTVLAPLIVSRISPQKSAAVLQGARNWIIRYQRALILGVLVVLGIYLVVSGILDLLL